jgi:catechol 2,3-dioxygenase-like lactoylglutathione lyase family enzyme
MAAPSGRLKGVQLDAGWRNAMRVKGFSWVGVGVDDFHSALDFFEGVLGLQRVVVDDRGVAMLKVADGQLLELFGPGTRGYELNSPPVAAFEVEDLETACDELRTEGIELIGGVGRWNGFEWVYFRGPGGHTFALEKTPPAGWEVSD